MGMMILAILSFSLIASAVCDYPQCNDQIGLQAERDGDVLTVSLVARSHLVFGGLEGSVIHEEGVEFLDYDASRFSSKDYYDVTKRFSMSSGGDLIFENGETIWSIRYRIPDGFRETHRYWFDMHFTEAADPDENDYSWGESSFTVVYNESGTYTVAFKTEDGLLGDYTAAVKDGDCLSAVPEDPVRSGFTFLGWSADCGATILSKEELENIEVDRDVTYEAVWKQDSGNIEIASMACTDQGVIVELDGQIAQDVQLIVAGYTEKGAMIITRAQSIPESVIGDNRKIEIGADLTGVAYVKAFVIADDGIFTPLAQDGLLTLQR